MIKTKHTKRQRISTAKFNLLITYFCEDFTSTTTSKLLNLNRKTIDRYYNYFRDLILKECEERAFLSGRVEADESYFGAKRIRGKRGRGAGGKIPVIGLLKRNGKVYTQIVQNCSRQELMPIIQGKVLEGSTIYTDAWRAYDGLVLNGYKHYRIHHHKNEFARGKNHINGIESFWSFTKSRMKKFNGIKKDKFLLYLKESEWRWNYRGDKRKKMLKSLIRKSRNRS